MSTTINLPEVRLHNRTQVTPAGSDEVLIADASDGYKLKKALVSAISGGGGSSDGAITCVFDGGGSAISANSKVYLEIPFAFTITGWTIVADTSGSIVIDVWRDSYANYPPNVADSITGTEKPTLSSAQKNQDLTLSTWTTAVSAGDTLVFNVDSATTVTKATLVIRGTK